MDKKTILNLSKKYSSFYLYDESQILSNISQLYHAFPNIKLLYSIKSNSNQEVLKTIFNNNLGADAASINEVFMAQKLGLSRNNIFYSAPGKSPEEGLKNSTLIAGSIKCFFRCRRTALTRFRCDFGLSMENRQSVSSGDGWSLLLMRR